MIYGLYQSAAGMLTTEYQQTVAANNLANADTVGFKRDVAIFAERLPAAEAGQRSGASAATLAALSGGQWLGQTFTDYSPGAKAPTGNPLDVAIDGLGFFSVAGPDGQPLYTRDGRFQVDRRGQLVAATDGAPVLARGGLPVHTNPLGGQVSVNEIGEVVQDGHAVAELDVVDFTDYALLRKVGANRVAAPQGTAAPAYRRMEAGFTESSGVQPLPELVGMIAAARTYQMNAQMISLQDQSVGRLLSVISR